VLGIRSGDPYLFTGHELGSSTQWLNGFELSGDHGAAGSLCRKAKVAAVAAEIPVWIGVPIPVLGLAEASPWLCSYGSSFHPNDAGNAAIAHLVEQAFPHLNWGGFQPPGQGSTSSPSTPSTGSPQTPSAALTGTWSHTPQLPALPPAWGLAPGALVADTCTNPSFCVVIGTSLNLNQPVANNPAIAYSYVDGSWTAPVELPVQSWELSSPVLVSCASVSYCVVVASQLGSADTSYVDINGSWSGPIIIGTQSNIQGLTCAAVDQCTASTQAGTTYAFNGSAWVGPAPTTSPAPGVTTIPDPSGLPADLQGVVVSCGAVGSSCVALADVPLGSDMAAGVIDYAYQYSSGQWSRIHTFSASLEAGWDGISCPDTSFCLGVGGTGNVDAGPVVAFYGN